MSGRTEPVQAAIPYWGPCPGELDSGEPSGPTRVAAVTYVPIGSASTVSADMLHSDPSGQISPSRHEMLYEGISVAGAGPAVVSSTCEAICWMAAHVSGAVPGP